jgi:hypothetical protein
LKSASFRVSLARSGFMKMSAGSFVLRLLARASLAFRIASEVVLVSLLGWLELVRLASD